MESDHFPVPVCRLFRESRVGGQVCYEANLNRFDKSNWETSLDRGLSLIIDTNDEYDVKNLIERTPEEKGKEDRRGFDSYTQTEEENSFHITLQTISRFRLLRYSHLYPPPQTPSQ